MKIVNDFLTRYLYAMDPDFGFKAQGRKIRNNAKNKRYAWSSHLHTCKKIVSDFITSDTNRKSLSILGAGSLLDIPEDIFNSHYQVIYLQDANPSCLSEWSKHAHTNPLKPVIEPCLLDISGDISLWSKMCREEIKQVRLSGALSFIKKLPVNNIGKPAFIRAQSCISMNILSQLPVYWQDFIFSMLSKKYGVREVKKNEEEILRSLRKTSKSLVQNHLNDILPKKKNQRTLLVTDLTYFYSPKNVSLSISNNTEAGEKKISSFSLQVESDQKIVQVEEQDALFDVLLEPYLEKKSKSAGISYTIMDSWLWQIRKEKNKNTSHQVVAIELSKET